jgi:hypothetical protein
MKHSSYFYLPLCRTNLLLKVFPEIGNLNCPASLRLDLLREGESARFHKSVIALPEEMRFITRFEAARGDSRG